MSTDSIRIRTAAATDSARISRMYLDAYSDPRTDKPSGYPFPQFFDPEWIADAVTRGTIHWVVTEAQTDLVATVGAVSNIGSNSDRIAECCGLVVDRRFRRRGFAQRLFRYLTELLCQEAAFCIGETRTANPGGWRVVRNCGFIPIGFEPFAHVTPAGVEAMLLTALVPPRTYERRRVGVVTTHRVQRLAFPILSSLDRQPYESDDHPVWPVQRSPNVENVRSVCDFVGPDKVSAERTELVTTFRVKRDDIVGRQVLVEWPEQDRHHSGVAGFRRLEGFEQGTDRFEQQFFVVSQHDQPVACARVAWDGLDRRARMLDLRIRVDGLQGIIINEIREEILRSASDQPVTIVVDVRSDAPTLQATLEMLGFFPTAYYPGMIAADDDRIDVVQYTSLTGRRLADSWNNVNDLNWRQAGDVITCVAGPAPV